MEALSKRLQEIDDLPTLPGTAVKLIDALAGDKGAADVEQVIRGDEAMAAAVLRTANAASMGATSGRVFTLQESIARLGGRHLQRIAMSLSTNDLLENAGRGYGLLRGELWRGGLCGALGAEMIAKHTDMADPGTCFVAGLLRDIGKIAMDMICDPASMEAAFTACDEGGSQLDRERRNFGLDHAELGAELARKWGLPEDIVTAIRGHHEPGEGDERHALTDIVHCADVLTCWLAVGVGLDGLAYELSPAAAEHVGLTRPAIEMFLPELRVLFDQTEMELKSGSVE